MVPLIALIVSFAAFRTAGYLGAEWFDGWAESLRPAVAVMFLLTASAHWGAKRKDLTAMVPPTFRNPGFIVTLTGWLEIAGAIGILVPGWISTAAAAGLTLMLLAMFPANVYAARKRLTLSGRPVIPIVPRTVLQILFLAATVGAGWPQA